MQCLLFFLFIYYLLSLHAVYVLGCTLFFETEFPIQSVAETVSSWDPPQHQPCHYRHVPQHLALCLDVWFLNSCARLSRRYGLQGTTFPALRYILCLHFPLFTWTLQYVPFIYQSLNPSAHLDFQSNC